VDFPGIGTIDLDTTKLLSNDREMLEVVTEQMFADPSILDTIASVTSTLCQDEGAGDSAPPPLS
jgi:phosphoenolpyruvate-protein kinase (PTS system EI component)